MDANDAEPTRRCPCHTCLRVDARLLCLLALGFLLAAALARVVTLEGVAEAVPKDVLATAALPSTRPTRAPAPSPGSNCPSCALNVSLSAVVVSLNETRFRTATAAMHALGITKVIKKVPVPLNDSRILARFPPSTNSSKRMAGTLSNLLSFTEAFDEFAREPGDPQAWRLFLEEDVGLNPTLAPDVIYRAIVYGMELARTDGFLRLGVCGDTKLTRGKSWDAMSKVERNGVAFERSKGRCVHATAATRWRSATVMQSLESSKRGMPGYLKFGFELYFDVRLHRYEVVHNGYVSSIQHANTWQHVLGGLQDCLRHVAHGKGRDDAGRHLSGPGGHAKLA